MCVTFGVRSAFVFQARRHVLAKQNAKNKLAKAQGAFRGVASLREHITTPLLLIPLFLLHLQQTNSTSSCMTWRDHYTRCTGVNWAMSLSGCGIPTLKLKICLLQLEVRTPSSDWGKETGLNRLLAGCRCEMKWQEHVGFLPLLMQSDAIPGNYKQKNMASIIRRIWLLHLKWQYLLFSNAIRISIHS